MVTLYVGESKLEFHLHGNVLFDASPVLRKAFTSDSEVGLKEFLDLPDDNAGLFDHLITCIYSKSFDIQMFEDATSDGEREVKAAELFALAEKYDVETVTFNIAIGLYAHARANRYEKIPYESRKNFPPERLAVEIAEKSTSRDSILRKVFIDWYSVCNVRGDTDLRHWLSTVPEFASDLVVTESREEKYFMMNEEEYFWRLAEKQHRTLKVYILRS